ncbi:hypothetical protein R3P38DRAFT_3210107 [Favolaschia claudopus]|uniref:Uncharacterized protein n=1 Tax=Favolaschia claudopus TaxID=2862362 RepID=A0AAW0AIG0_9AGAR
MCLEEAHQAGLAGLSRANVSSVQPKTSIKFRGRKRKRQADTESEEDSEGEDAIRDLVKPRKLNKPRKAKKLTVSVFTHRRSLRDPSTHPQQESGKEEDGQENEVEDDGAHAGRYKQDWNAEDEDYNADDDDEKHSEFILKGKTSGKKNLKKRIHLRDKGNAEDSPMYDVEPFEEDASLSSRKGKKGPEPMSTEDTEIRRRAMNAKRRQSRAAKAPGPLIISREDQEQMAEFMTSVLFDHVKKLHSVSDGMAHAPTKLSALLSMDAAMREASSLAVAPDDNTFNEKVLPLVEVLHCLAEDPLHFNPQPWVAQGLLFDDTQQFLEPNKTARFYVRVATIPAKHVAQYILDRMLRRPSDIPYLAMTSLVYGLGVTEVQTMVASACARYGLADVALVVNDAIFQLEFPARVKEKMDTSQPMTLVYAGVCIAGTPGSRLYDDLYFRAHSRFVNWGKKLRWIVLCFTPANIPAPDGELSFRRNPLISRTEAFFVNALLGLGMNTTEGGSWVPCFQPSLQTKTLIQASNIALPVLSRIDGLDDSRRLKLEQFLDSEHKFWPKESVCVAQTLQSIKHNLINAAWTLQGTVVAVTIAEDITEEERSGRIGGIETETTGPALKEAAHSVALLHPHADLTDISEMRHIRGAFTNIYRMQEVVDRALHLALLSRLLTVVEPVLVVGWSNTVHHVFFRLELRDVFQGSDADISAFLGGNTQLARQVVPSIWYRDMMETVSGPYLKAIGVPFISFYGPHRHCVLLFIPNIEPGAAKHDPLLAPLQREIYHLVRGGIDEPAKALIAQDIFINGAFQHRDRESRLIRILGQLRHWLNTTGVDVALEGLKVQYRALKAAVTQLRSLHYRVVGDADDDSTCPEEAEEEVDSEDELRKVAPRRSIYAAVGLEARKEQLARFEADAELARLHGRPEDPFHIAPYKKPIGSPEFAAFILRADDGKDLVRRAASQGGSEGAIVRIADNFAAFELWKKDKAAARRVPDAAGVTPQMHTERQARQKILTAALASFADPRTLENHEFTEALRWFVCSRCSEVVLATSKNSKHCCGAGSEGVKITLESSPNQRRLVFIHDVLHNRQLLTILGQSPGFVPDGVVARTVDEVFADEANVIQLKSALPLDHARLQYKGVETMVYLPVALVDNSYLWVTLAVDVLLRDQCVPKLEPHTAEQLDFWRNSNDTLTTWAADRFLGKSHDKPLYIFKCRRGGFAVTTSIRSRLERPQYFLHDCAYTVDEYKKPEVAAARPKNPDQKANGPRSCPDQEIEPVGCLLELPPTHARVVWAIERLPNLVRISRSKAKEEGGEKAKKKGKKENAEMEDEGKEPTVKKRKEKKAKAGDGKGKGKEVEEVKVKTVKKRKVGQPKVGGNVAGPSNAN